MRNGMFPVTHQDGSLHQFETKLEAEAFAAESPSKNTKRYRESLTTYTPLDFSVIEENSNDNWVATNTRINRSVVLVSRVVDVTPVQRGLLPVPEKTAERRWFLSSGEAYDDFEKVLARFEQDAIAISANRLMKEQDFAQVRILADGTFLQVHRDALDNGFWRISKVVEGVHTSFLYQGKDLTFRTEEAANRFLKTEIEN